MATTTPVGYNPSQSPISGTIQVGNLAVGASAQEYSRNPGDVKFWMTPDQDPGFVIAKPIPAGNQPYNPAISATGAYVGFSRSSLLTQQSFVATVNQFAAGATSFTSIQGDQAKSWLNNNGYWTSYSGITPSQAGLILDWDIQNYTSYTGSGSSITDLEGNSNGTLSGTISYTSSTPSYLLVEGGASEYIVSASNLNSKLSPANTGTSISVFVWAYPTENGVIVSEQGSTSINSGWHDSQMEMVSGTIKFGVWNGSGISSITSSISTPLNTWYYLGYTYDGTTLRGYVNGISAGSTTVSRSTPYNQSGTGLYYALGVNDFTNMGDGTGMTFRFGGMQVYNIGLTASTVTSNFNTTKTNYGFSPLVSSGLTMQIDATNPSSYSGSGSTWSDISGNSANITLVNSPTFASGVPSYFSFNGTDQYGTGSASNVVPSTAYTKSVWFRLGSLVDNNLLSSSLGGHFMFLSGTSTLYCGHSNWGSYLAFPSATTFSLNTWYNATLTFNTTDGMVLYVNGVQDSTYTANKTAHSGNGSTNIGCFSPGGNLLNGRIGIAYCYNKSLSASEVLQNYNSDKWKFGL